MAIYDTMQLVRPDVATWAVGLAASMGQFLLTAGAPGKRYALPHARILMHQPSASLGGTASDISIRAGVFGEMKREIAELTARHTGQTGGDRDRRRRPRPLVRPRSRRGRTGWSTTSRDEPDRRDRPGVSVSSGEGRGNPPG